MVTGIDISRTEANAATPRPASTVILVRETGNSLQVCLLRRSDRSDFMPGTFVFPGGTVEPGDDDPAFWSDRVDVSAEALSGSPDAGMTHGQALAHAVAAIRETFEETNIFLGSDPRDPADGPGRKDAFGAMRFREWVSEGKRVLGVSRLHPWSHWITPVVRMKRYDTRFFLALVPSSVQCMSDGEETTEGLWLSPATAIEENERGNVPLSPPTLVTLYELLACKDRAALGGVLRTRSWGTARIPRLGNTAEGVIFFLPGDPAHGSDGPEKQEAEGTPFSSLRFDGRLWHLVEKGPAK